MIFKVIKTILEYNTALKRTIEIFQAEEDTPEADELALLLVLIKDYEDKNITIPHIDPIEAVKLKMDERGMKAKDLEPFLRSKGHVSSILSKRRKLTLKTAIKLHEQFQIPAEVFFMSNKIKKRKEAGKPSNFAKNHFSDKH